MNKEHLSCGNQTSDSFYSSGEFNYHHKKGDYECRIILDNRQRAIDALLLYPTITKQLVDELINYIQKDTDTMISQLLNEATDLRKKLRAQKTNLESIIRQLKSKIRGLSEENIQMTSQLQTKQRIHKQEVTELRKIKKQQKLEISYLNKQIEGMQGLINEYQNQLEKKDKQIEVLRKQFEEKQAYYENAKIQINNQSKVIQQLKQKIYYLERQYQTQEIINNTKQNDQINLLIHKDRLLQNQVSDRQCLIHFLSQDGVKKEKQIENLKQTVSKLNDELLNEKNTKVMQKNKQKNSLLKLQNASQTAINSIKFKYNLKMQKIVQMLSKQLRTLKNQLEIVKTSAVKQIQLCSKQNKGILITQIKAFYSK